MSGGGGGALKRPMNGDPPPKHRPVGGILNIIGGNKESLVISSQSRSRFVECTVKLKRAGSVASIILW